MIRGIDLTAGTTLCIHTLNALILSCLINLFMSPMEIILNFESRFTNQIMQEYKFVFCLNVKVFYILESLQIFYKDFIEFCGDLSTFTNQRM